MVSWISQAILMRSMVNYRYPYFDRRLEIASPPTIPYSTHPFAGLEHFCCRGNGPTSWCGNQQFSRDKYCSYQRSLCLRVILPEPRILRERSLLGLLRGFCSNL